MHSIQLFEKEFKISGSNVDPSSIDFDKIGLFKQRTFDKGRLVNVKYWKQFDGISTYSDLYVEEIRVFTDYNGYLYRRDLTINWYFVDDTIGYILNTIKYYSVGESYGEGILRRDNIIKHGVFPYLLNTVGLSDGNCRDLFASVHVEHKLYLESNDQLTLINVLQGLNKTYLTQQIKDNIVALISY